jgi:hypothetical protein
MLVGQVGDWVDAGQWVRLGIAGGLLLLLILVTGLRLQRARRSSRSGG